MVPGRTHEETEAFLAKKKAPPRTVEQILDDIRKTTENDVMAIKSANNHLRSEKLYLELLLAVRRPVPKPKKQSRASRWSEQASVAVGALEELVGMQSDFESAKDNMPEGLSSSPYGEKLETICGIDLESALEAAQEAEGADVPLGYGRD